MSICVTTGYKYIGRENWDEFFARDESYYYDGFRKLVFECPYPIVAFLEERDREVLKDVVSPLLTVLPMEGLNILPYTHMEKDWEIMNSYEHEVLMKGSKHSHDHPELSEKGYNMVTSFKSNLVLETHKAFPDYDFYAWQDFGAANHNGGIPKVIDETKLDRSKIIVNGMSTDPRGEYIDAVGLARSGGAPYVCSAQTIVPAHLTLVWDTFMRRQIDANHEIYLTDDDQSILAKVVSDFPHFFDWVSDKSKDWFNLYDLLCKRRG